MASILVVDDSNMSRRMVGQLLANTPVYKLRYAEHGVEALEKIEEELPDLVLTDLQMPEMDGLELVRKVTLQRPGLPIVLMTAHGSEDIAIKALEEGAASYLPKSQLSGKLLETLDEIFALAGVKRTYERLNRCIDRTTFQLSLANDPALIDPLLDLVCQVLSNMDLCDRTRQLQIGVALKQAVLNAMLHGNLEITRGDLEEAREGLIVGETFDLIEQRRHQPPYQDRLVRVDIALSPDEARFEIEDQGPGFDVGFSRQPDPTLALGSEQGRGLVLMCKFMDEVIFNETGNRVTMVKRKSE